MATTGMLEADLRGFDAAAASGVVLVDFWAPWCAPCRMQEPALAEVAGRFQGQVKVLKVNVDEQAVLAARFRVQAIPLLVVLRDGREVTRLVGVHPARELEKTLREAF